MKTTLSCFLGGPLNTLVLLAEHEKQVAITQGREKWTSVFRGIDDIRTIVALWTIVSQQLTVLVHFSAYGAYVFRQAGVGDPFQVKCILLCNKLVGAVAVVYYAENFGSRFIGCSGTTAMWATSFLVGFLCLAKQGKTVNG
ncbi:hypothetical protein FSARC_1833 [Fusarium sarcochroum]|uniref:Uncharacterized protein n=1 Tax=Fusarium sarcochroum TaxID=1208366 RepID=A0A8H4XEL6_9HYPO|nr:hypothetical protein FSARC_1833 [Fusarium sarcochroum]